MKKILIIFLSMCFLLTTSASVIGYIEHKKQIEEENNTPVNLITYEYYFENEKQDVMPTNTNGEVKYIFSKYICTNNLIGIFDSNLWKFTPSEDKTATCSLYFVKSQYEVEITATNGIVQNDEDGKFLVPRENDGSFVVIPNEGYKYKNVVCSNENEAVFDISTNTLTISSVMEDISCQVNFEIKKLKAKINVVNGTGSTTETQKYGSDINVIVKAKEGYEKPTVKCTNNQNASIKNNTLTISKITDNTTCTVTYKKEKPVTYNLKITILSDKLTIVSGNTSQQIKKGSDGRFSVKPQEGYKVSLKCNVNPSESIEDPDGTVNYVFLSVSKDISCSADAIIINN